MNIITISLYTCIFLRPIFCYSFELRKLYARVFMDKWIINPRRTRSSHQRCSMKKVFLEISQNSQENTCARVSFLIKLQPQDCNFIEKETLAQVISCEFREISKNVFFHREHLRWLLLKCTFQYSAYAYWRTLK